MSNHRFERGQTITFHVFAIIIAFALTLFVMNYTNTVRWHIRAQNAADEVAMASLAGEATLENQRSMALYALDVDLWRVQSIAMTMTNAANGQGTSPTESTLGNLTATCNTSEIGDDSGYDCDNIYDQQPVNYDKAVTQYAAALNALENLTNSPAVPAAATAAPGAVLPSPFPVAPANSTAASAFSVAANGSSCQGSGGAFDCAFSYNANLSQTGPNTKEIVDVVACRRVPTTAPLIFGSGIFGSTQFSAIGRGAATLVAVTETFKPGQSPDPNATGAPLYLPIESCSPSNYPGGAGPCSSGSGWMPAAAYVTDFKNLVINATFYYPAPTTPQGTPPPTLCKQG